MNALSVLTANLLFYAEVIVFIMALITIKSRVSRYLLLHALIVVIMTLPYYLAANQLLLDTGAFRLTDAALILFPVSAALISARWQDSLKARGYYILYALAGVSFFSCLFSPGYRIEALFLLHAASWAVIIFYICHKKPNIFARAYYLVCACGIIALGILFFVHRDRSSLAVTSGTMSIGIICIIVIDFINRVIDVSKRFEKINEMNKKLTHTVSRLKISNEQIRKIIMQKDVELLQLSRHASLAEITTGIAHELSQPLTGIKGIAQNMIDDINYDDFDKLQAVSELHKISSLVDKSSSIIDHIRNFSKKSLFTMKTIDLNSTVLDAIDLINYQLKKNDIDLVFILDENLPKIMGNTISLEQMIVNIILNGRDAILEKKQGTVKTEGKIHVTTSADTRNVVLTIEDNGTGIPDDIIQKIWSPFFTTKSRGQGTGIGLSICSRIIREHRAQLDLRTNKKGTSFIIKFPVNPNQSGDKQ